ncbi:MAG: hypothetical protein H6765_11070 [Candidatus Peribacteria bacterium]|nr:MAG: hypothetical protein H6765_11070 [Candidatus Peribacteria bacterium]
MIGFDTIPEESFMDPNKFVSFNKEVQIQRNIEELLIGAARFDQVETYPWIQQQWIDRTSMETDNCYEMENSLSPEQRFLRPNLNWHIVEVLEKNAPIIDSLRVFDI